MIRSWLGSASAAALVLSGLAACGGNQPDPAAAGASSSGGSSPSDAGGATPSDPASSSGGISSSADAGAPAATVATTDAGAGAGSTGGNQVISEAKDECTPVGVDFEKRARPKLKECYATGKKKDPNLEGTVKIKITVDVKGKIKAVKVIEKTLPDAVATCMLKAVQATPFPEVDKCWDSTLTIPVTFPTPK